MRRKIIGIYCIENLVDGKRYIGKSVDVNHRLGKHKRLLSKPVYDKACNRHLYNAVQLYGLHNFHFGIIEVLGVSDGKILADRELYWMDFYAAHDRRFGYNILRESNNRLYQSDETKELISKANTGKVRTEEMINKLKGRTHSAEARLEMSYRRKGVPKSKAHVDAVAASKRGVTQSPSVVAARTEMRSVYSYEQYDIYGTLIATFSRISDVVLSGYSKSAVLKTCSGKHSTHKGFIWRKIPKLPLSIETS